MKSEEFFLLLGDIDGRYLSVQPRRAVHWKRWIGLAACAAVVLALSLMVNRSTRIPLSDASTGVTARYVDRLPGTAQSSNCLVALTEEELFTRWDTLIFRGTIAHIQNIELNFHGMTFQRAIATVQVETVYRGTAAETITILLPCPIGTEVHVSATETAAAMREGMTGIFMPMVYDETSLFQANGGTLCLRDIAETGLPDGVRWAFLETPSGLLFDRHSFTGAAEAETLDEIERYIADMLSRSIWQ